MNKLWVTICRPGRNLHGYLEDHPANRNWFIPYLVSPICIYIYKHTPIFGQHTSRRRFFHRNYWEKRHELNPRWMIYKFPLGGLNNWFIYGRVTSRSETNSRAANGYLPLPFLEMINFWGTEESFGWWMVGLWGLFFFIKHLVNHMWVVICLS